MDSEDLDREELQWLRGFVQGLRLALPTSATTGFLGYVLGGPPPRDGELPAAEDDLNALRRLADTLPARLRRRGDEALAELALQVESLGGAAAGRGALRARVASSEPAAGQRTLVRLAETGYVLDRSDAAPTVVDRADDLTRALGEIRAPAAASVARVVELTGARVDSRGFQNLGGLIEAQLGVRVRGPQPDLDGYEIKTLTAAAKVDRPFVVLFGKAPERLVERAELLRRYSRNGRTLDMGRLRFGAADPRFYLTADETGFRLADVKSRDGLLRWRWSEIEERLLEKMSRLILLQARQNGSEMSVLSTTVFLEPNLDEFRRTILSRNFRLHVRLQERSGRDTFEFSVNLPALRRIYKRWLAVRPAV